MCGEYVYEIIMSVLMRITFPVQIIYWISENLMSFNAFDQIQEFILGE